MTKAATIYGSKTQSDALRPGPLRPANIIRNKFPTYKNGSNGIVIKLADGPEIPPLKEIVAKETADLLDRRQRLSVRELAMKFEKGLSTATLLSNEVEILTVQLSKREAELVQQKEEVTKLAKSLKQASEDAKRIVEEERANAHTEIETAKGAVQRVQQAVQEHEKMSQNTGKQKQDMEELKKEVREARRIKMLHQPSKAMDLENEIRILRNTFAEKSKDCVSLLKELETHKRLKENGTIPSFDLEGLQCLGSMLRIVGLSGTHMDLSNISIQWFRIHPKESNKEIISGATRPVYALEPHDVGRYLQAEIDVGGEIAVAKTAGPVDPDAGLVDYVETLVRKPETEFNVRIQHPLPLYGISFAQTCHVCSLFTKQAQPLKPRTGVFLTAPWPLLCVLLQQVVVLQSNGVDQPKESVHVLNVGRLRMRLTKGKSVVAKEFYSSSMQLCGVRGGGEAASQAMFWRPRNDLSLVLAFESTRERNAAIMLARRFAVDCNVCAFTKRYIILAGPGDKTPW
ncbi:Stomatal closure-related actin-binding protein 1 [Zea mays]|uniref:Stomatal closure-related actin-binding protein 1 n=1 Tax=Zea mays TaxID=4577 RepID=A0A1D6P9G2_MAIZE|nr:Stomatal closure-related actin-binding protein 1 [Zea mays]